MQVRRKQSKKEIEIEILIFALDLKLLTFFCLRLFSATMDTMDLIEYNIIFELLTVTLFSLYSVFCFSMWNPFIFSFNCPEWIQIILQFLFIGLPQATIIMVPQYSLAMYFVFGLFGLLGSLVSYLQ